MDGFRWELPDAFNFGRDVVDRYAEDPARPALLARTPAGAERRLSFADVRDGARRAANLLSQLGVGPGDPVIVMLPRVPEWQLVTLGALEIGALVIPSSTVLRAKDIGYRAAHSGAVAIVATRDQVPAVEAAR